MVKLNLIKQIDIFGVPISLRINKMERSKTFFGGLLTIILSCFMLAMFFLNISSLFKRESPTISIEQTFVNNPSINIDPMKMPFGFFLSYINNSNIGEKFDKYFTLRVETKEYNNINITEILTLLPVEQCNEEKFPLKKEDAQNAAIKQSTCINSNNYSLFGGWDQAQLKYLSFSIYACKNSTSEQKCPPMEEIIEFVRAQPIFFNFIMVEERINVYEYIQFSQFTLRTFYRGFRSDSSKLVELYISNNMLESDNGILYSQKDYYKSMKVDRLEFDEFDFSPNESQFFNFVIYPSKNFYISHRFYVKLPQILANLGGMSRILQITFFVLSSFYSNLAKNQNILNTLFSFDLNENISSEIQKIGSSSSTLRNLQQQSVYIKSPLSSRKLKNNRTANGNNCELSRPDRSTISKGENNFQEELINKILTSYQKKTLVITFSEMYRYLFCKCSLNSKTRKKFELYQKSSQILNMVLDITHVIGKLEEFEKFKLVILNTEQLALFNFISKQMISKNINIEGMSKITQLMRLNTDLESLLKLLIDFKSKMTHDKNLSGINKKLYSLLSNDLKDFVSNC
jgi:hypothetical protein